MPVSIPKVFKAIAASFCSFVKSSIDSPSCSSALLAILGGPANLIKPALSAVPALLALMPLLAIIPAKAAVSSIDAPNACATGAAYFIVSPNISTLVFVDVIVTA